MRYTTVVAVWVVLNIANLQVAVSADQTQSEPTAASEDSATAGDELHFFSVLRFRGEIASVDPAKRLITLQGPKGEVLTLEARNEEDLTARKVGERVQVRYFEGAQIGKRTQGEVAPVESLQEGMIAAETGGPSGKQHALGTSVKRVDAVSQEITLIEPDGSLETIMVSNPEYLSHIKVGDLVVITRPQGLALSVEKKVD